MATKTRASSKDRAAQVDANLRRLAPELTVTERRRIVAVDREPPVTSRPIASADVLAFGARARAARAELCALLKDVQFAVRTLDDKLVDFERRYVDLSPLEPPEQVSTLLARIATVAADYITTHPPIRDGRPPEKEKMLRVYRIADLFPELKRRAARKRKALFRVSSNAKDTKSGPPNTFANVVRAIVFRNGDGDPSRYLKPFARSRGVVRKSRPWPPPNFRQTVYP
jgi:hypothetical protein